jgi:hypothetical protein
MVVRTVEAAFGSDSRTPALAREFIPGRLEEKPEVSYMRPEEPP